MTERKPLGATFESWVDKQIREATERGEFDNLPGAGKPLPGAGEPLDEQWWLKAYLHREGGTADGMLPPSLVLRRDLERLPETVRTLRFEQEVRDTVAELNDRVTRWLRMPTGPYVQVSPVDVDQIVEEWRGQRRRDQATGGEAGESAPPAKRSWWRRGTR
ncbi:DUF1992 domain-containing protein [Nocardia sp. NPDC051911]|uniref:DnaJ family domain-containing protein n=1 Tax=Nocardia sp. NPDC051911 TaxID=3154648 RepID=UPI0034477405